MKSTFRARFGAASVPLLVYLLVSVGARPGHAQISHLAAISLEKTSVTLGEPVALVVQRGVSEIEMLLFSGFLDINYRDCIFARMPPVGRQGGGIKVLAGE